MSAPAASLAVSIVVAVLALLALRSGVDPVEVWAGGVLLIGTVAAALKPRTPKTIDRKRK